MLYVFYDIKRNAGETLGNGIQALSDLECLHLIGFFSMGQTELFEI